MTLNILSSRENGGFSFSGLHQDILLYRKESDSLEVIETTGMWIGMVECLGEMNKDEVFCMNTGDVLLLYTDGLTEARGPAGSMYTLNRLKEIFQNNAGEPLERIKEGIIGELRPFRTDDDVTVILAKRL